MVIAMGLMLDIIFPSLQKRIAKASVVYIGKHLPSPLIMILHRQKLAVARVYKVCNPVDASSHWQ
ncbi:hypothetical protein RchiOBHm_Chr2g0122861 [Rosa chinensis]|uniref:Uncharacterized protein n=1 Tax=Rosa chinensis TaxID=74649 RepID=A0A2P6RSY0_ROSCH|nr:hypothetical protein RchiOBHm_Chr2g0122861 [Rosa chinensis]